MDPPRRRRITDAERRSLRQKASTISTQSSLKEWFLHEYHHKLSQSSISEILSSKYAYLDDINPTARARRKLQQTSKIRTSYWPDLERALFEWQG